MPSALFNPGIALDESSVLGSVVEAYWREGFDAGYRRAKFELVAVLALSAAEFIRAQPQSGSDVRKAIRSFVDYVEQSFSEESKSPGYVEGGLGI
jgi:hypothetical protein